MLSPISKEVHVSQYFHFASYLIGRNQKSYSSDQTFNQWVVWPMKNLADHIHGVKDYCYIKEGSLFQMFPL
jgi:hypothetical protein